MIWSVSSHVTETGECVMRSDEDYESDSDGDEAGGSDSSGPSGPGSGGGNNDQCLAASNSSFLQKTNYYDGWVYIGKETYGSKVLTSSSLKPGTKFFDALGRMYDKVKAKMQYYVRKDAINREEREIPLEFEVWARIIKDADGNDIHAFVKEDKRNGLRKDSSFYFDGYWEVFEFDDVAKEVSLNASSGIKFLRKYDNKERLIKNYSIAKNGDTLTSEQYFWQDGHLVRMIENGVTRNYFYGKTLQDTIRVIPSDYGINFHSGYDGSVGKMPEENDPLYKYFVRNPYGYTFYEMKNDENITDYSVLLKLPTEGSPKFFCPEVQKLKSNMPPVECIRYSRRYIESLNSSIRRYPNKRDTLLYGESDATPDTTMSCECINGKYKLTYVATTMNEYIQVMKSGWRRTESAWQEFCWTKEEMQDTYDHEVLHIEYAREMVKELYKSTFKDTLLDTERGCHLYGTAQFLILMKKWDLWYDKEKKHDTDKWKGKVYGQPRIGVQCLN